jgi:hypothetical protein
MVGIMLITKGFSQELFDEPPSKLITEFRFKILSGGIVLLKATVGDKTDTLNFILDTGSGGISLDSTSVEYFGYNAEPSNRIIRGIGGTRKVSFVNDQTLHLPDLSIKNLNFHIVDYSVLSSVYGLPIDGIIGYSVLSKYIVALDYDSLKISFYTQGDFKLPKDGWTLHPMITTLPIHQLTISDARSYMPRVLYDMGAGLNLLLTKEFIKDSALLKKRRKFYNKQAEGLGGKVDLLYTVIKQARLGPYKFRKVPVLIYDDVQDILSYPYLGGLIGNDILRRFNVVMDYQKSQFHLKPNTHFKDPFDYSYSGIELYLIHGAIVIGDVAKGSPAEKAGLREGDIVMALNNNFSQVLYLYKQMLQEPGIRMKIMIRRNGELLEFVFKIKNILH